ncbi:MAG: hypothetical protein IJO76_00245 [Clostridia bacterium]|nr:hypothetical protein [Clostridia bacterium]
MEQQPNVTFLSDLKKEESIAFTLLQAEVTGPLRRKKATRIMSVVFFLLMGGITLWDWHMMGKIDPLFACSVPIMWLPALFTECIVPAMLKKRAAKAYDRAAAAGNTFSGEVRLYPDRVEKITNVGGTKLPLNGHTLFVERADMLVFLNRFNPAVVLPARCMTEELAAAVRKAADTLPLQNRRFFSRLQPMGEPIAVPTVAETLPVLWECNFTYTAEEFASVLRHSIVSRFWSTSPGMAAVSLVGALVMGNISLWSTVLYFVLCFGVLTLFHLVLPLSRVKQTVSLPSYMEDARGTVKIDRYAIRVSMGKEGEMPLPWVEDVHVYDKDGFAEIAAGRRTLFYIPKRCITDLEGFNRVITQCRGKQLV